MRTLLIASLLSVSACATLSQAGIPTSVPESVEERAERRNRCLSTRSANTTWHGLFLGASIAAGAGGIGTIVTSQDSVSEEARYTIAGLSLAAGILAAVAGGVQQRHAETYVEDNCRALLAPTQ